METIFILSISTILAAIVGIVVTVIILFTCATFSRIAIIDLPFEHFVTARTIGLITTAILIPTFTTIGLTLL